MTQLEFFAQNGLQCHTYDSYHKLTKAEQKNYDRRSDELTQEWIKRFETMETLNKYGRGGYIGVYCRVLGISDSGTIKQKAERIMRWVEAHR